MKTKKMLLLLVFFVCSIHSQVQQEWVRTHSYSSNSDDVANDIAIDNSGNIYVVGNSEAGNTNFTSFTTIKYNSSGQQLWAKYFGSTSFYSGFSNCIALDNNNNVYITGQSNDRIMTIKYDEDGTELWTREYVEAGIDSVGSPIRHKIDAHGNIYVLGTFGDPPDMILIKYNPAGSISWVRKYDGSGVFDIAYSIALDGKGYIYLAGKSGITINDHEFVLLKYKESGVLQWARTQYCGGIPNGSPKVVCDADGNSYLAGSKDITPFSKDIFITKYSPFGEILWEITHNGTANSNDELHSIIIDAEGDLYATGLVENTGSYSDCFTFKYGPQGNLIWQSTYNGSANNDDAGLKLLLDNAGNLFAGGVTHEINGFGYDYMVNKYSSSNGSLQWTSSYNGAGNNTDVLRSMDLDVSGNLYVTGWTSEGTGLGITTIKYSQTIGIDPISTEVPDKFSLSQNYPNPFNPVTKIRFSVPAWKGSSTNRLVKISVYDMLGREAAIIVNEQLPAGIYEADWDATGLPSGVYFYKLSAGDYSETKKMMLVK